jgi:serine/threonine-protein kinase
MGDPQHQPDHETLDPEIARAVRAIVAQFASAWKNRKPNEAEPSIEAFLNAIPESGREIARQQLTAIMAQPIEGRSGGDAGPADTATIAPATINVPGSPPAVPDNAPDHTVDYGAAADPPAAPNATVDFDTGRPPNQTVDFVEHRQTGDVLPSGAEARPAKTGSGKRLVVVPGYDLLGVLGRGGMGIVYKARQKKLNRLVALKMVLSGPHARPDQLARFTTEAQAVARMQHPNIVQIYEIAELDGLPYFTLEYVDGGSLAERIHDKLLDPREAGRLMETVARAMAYAHRLNIIHRDIKPGNILMTSDGAPKIADFGLAKKLEDDSQISHSGAIMGTPAYMPPEQARGDTRNFGPAVDIYALGAMLYELLTGRPPFHGSSVIDTLQQVVTRDPLPVRQLQPMAPRDLETICHKCLQKDPAKRYLTADELADDLHRFLVGEPIKARPISSAERLWRWCKRHPREAGLIATAACLLVSVAVISTVAALNLARKNEIIATEKKNVDEQLRVSRATVGTTVNELPSIIEGGIYTEQVRLRVLGLMDKLRERNPGLLDKKGVVERGMIATKVGQGDTFKLQRNFDKARAAYEEALALAEKLHTNATSDVDTAAANLALVLARLGTFSDSRGNLSKAREYLNQALVLQSGIVESPRSGEIEKADALASMADTLSSLATIDLREHHIGNARQRATESLAARGQALEGISKDDPRTLVNLRQSASVNRLLAQVLEEAGDADGATKAFLEATRLMGDVVKAEPNVPLFRQVLAYTQADFGDFLLRQNRLTEAQTHYDQSLATIRFIAYPSEFDRMRSVLSLALYRSGTAALRRGDKITAKKHFDECLEIRERRVRELQQNSAAIGPEAGGLILSARIAQMLALARCGKHSEAEQIANNLFRAAGAQKKGDPNFERRAGWYFFAACGFALSEKPERAIESLNLAVDAGYRDIVGLETDPDLDPVRNHPNFRTLLAKVKAQVVKTTT